MHEDVEHLLKRHRAAMERHARTMRATERKRRKDEDRLDQAYAALRQRLATQPDPEADSMILSPPPDQAGSPLGSVTSLLKNLRALLF